MNNFNYNNYSLNIFDVIDQNCHIVGGNHQQSSVDDGIHQNYCDNNILVVNDEQQHYNHHHHHHNNNLHQHQEQNILELAPIMTFALNSNSNLNPYYYHNEEQQSWIPSQSNQSPQTNHHQENYQDVHENFQLPSASTIVPLPLISSADLCSNVNETYSSNFLSPALESNSHQQLSSKKFTCRHPNCDKSYSNVSGLNIHIKKKHSGSSTYPCDECLDTFPTTHKRTMHKIQQHEGRRYQAAQGRTSQKTAPLPSTTPSPPNTDLQKINTETEKLFCSFPSCDKEFTKLSNLKKHLIVYHSSSSSISTVASVSTTVQTSTSKLYKCLNCTDVFFNQKTDLARHRRNRHTGTGEYPCPECSKIFYTFDMYREHCNLHDENIPKYTCDECGKQFISQRKLKEHSIIHKERVMYKCDVCSKVFVRSQTLQYHRITCKAAFPCDKCIDSFVTAEALEKHKSFHRIDSFTCEKCNKMFPTQLALSNHEKRHSLRMNYTCQICKEIVSTRAKFQKHIKDHLENNLKCYVCNKEFKSLVKYGYHKAEMHSILLPYDCLLCSEQFCTRHELFMHLHNHIDGNSSNTFSCDQCDMKFSIKSTLKQHKKSHEKLPNQILQSEEEAPNSLPISIAQSPPLPAPSMSSSSSSPSSPKSHQSPPPTTATTTTTIPITSTSEIICQYTGCNEIFTSQNLLKRHQTIHRLKSYHCNGCKRKYYSEGVYQTHVRFCQPATDDVVLVADEDIDSGPVLCKMCNQLLENKKVLKFHRKFCEDKEAEEEEKQLAIKLRMELGSSNSSNIGGGGVGNNNNVMLNYSNDGIQNIEEVFVKTEIDEDEKYVPEI